MIWRERNVFVGALALLLVIGLGTQAGAQKLVGYDDGPVQRVHIDMATGTVTRGPVVSERSSPTCVSLENLDLSGFASTDTGACAVEWVTAATKSAGKSGFISGFEFSYGTTAADLAFGGPGGQVQIAFRAGYTKGPINAAGTTGTEIARFMFSGLPATTLCTDATDPTASPASGFVRAVLDPSMCLPDGPIAWSWKFVDIGNDSQGKTFPRLACISNCNNAGPDSNGMTNTIDRYLGAAYLDTITIPGTGTFDSSVSIRLLEVPNIPAASAVMNGTGANPLILSNTNLPRLDQPWGVDVDCTGADPTKAAIIRIGFTGIITPQATGFGELLVMLGGAFGQNFLVPHGGGLARLQAPIPKDAALACLSYGVQALCGDTPRGYLSNALAETIGTQ